MNDNELKINVKAFGINRLDLEMLKKNTNIGVEVSGIIISVGAKVKSFKVGDKVCSLVTEGGYQKEVTTTEETTFHLPNHLNFSEGAALPESLFTLGLNLTEFANIQPGERVLIHSATGGVGNLALELGRAMGLHVEATTSRLEHKEMLHSWGAQEVFSISDSWGVSETYDVILDNIGANAFSKNLTALKNGGRLAMVDAFSGESSLIDLGLVLDKSLQIYGSLLRPRTIKQKNKIKDTIEEKYLPLLNASKIRPHIMKSFPIEKVEDAHDLLKSRLHLGKLVGVRE
jgi:NADPH:quinone reductase